MIQDIDTHFAAIFAPYDGAMFLVSCSCLHIGQRFDDVSANIAIAITVKPSDGKLN